MKTMKKHISLLLVLAMLLGALAMLNTGVVAETGKLTLIPNSIYSIDTSKGIIRNVIDKTTVGTFVGNFESVVVYSKNGALLSNDALVGTGCTARLYSGNTLVQSLDIIVEGDVNGDGDITSSDTILVNSHLAGTLTVKAPYLYAADADKSGSVSSTDCISLTIHLSHGIKITDALYGRPYVISIATKMYDSYANAAADTNSIGYASAGTYYIHKSYPSGYNGYFCLTNTVAATGTGFWVKASAIGGSTDVSSSVPDSSEDDDESSSTDTEVGTYTVITSINKYATAANAQAQTNATGTVDPGTYYIYKNYPNGYNGMYNLTTDSTGASAGFWINPAENTDSPVTATPYVVTKDIPKYSTSADAVARTNSTGTATAGTYYIYTKYPSGYNGCYCLSNDPDGSTAAFWINPIDLNETTGTAYVLTQDMPKYTTADDAVNRTNSTGTAAAGTYYIYNKYPTGYNGVYCLSNDNTGATAGFWINPADATPVVTNGKLTIVRPINKYSSSTDAQRQTNINGTVATGTYYVYKNYPNGLNGMYNLTTDSTGATAGFWVNPIENTTAPLNYNTIKAIWLSQYDLSAIYLSGGSQTSKTTFTSKIQKILDVVKDTGFNTVFVQVRPNGDAFYQSSYYPASKYVTGSYSNSLTYDPFEIVVEECRKRAISVHAWVNPMRLMSTSDIASVSTAYKIGQWYQDTSKRGKYIVAVGSTYYLNPGYAETRQLIIDGVSELCNNYAIDGVHFDDYFYPEGTTTAFDKDAFTASGQSNLANFRRIVVSVMVKGCYDAVKAVNPNMLFGISPAGNITNNINMLYADVNTWGSQAGYVDYLAPQLYWGFECSSTSFEEALASWENLIKKGNVKLIGGLTLTKAYGETDSADGTEWTDHKDVIARQIAAMTDSPNFAGVAMFSLKYFYNASGGYYIGNLSSELNNFKPVLKALYTIN